MSHHSSDRYASLRVALDKAVDQTIKQKHAHEHPRDLLTRLEEKIRDEKQLGSYGATPAARLAAYERRQNLTASSIAGNPTLANDATYLRLKEAAEFEKAFAFLANLAVVLRDPLMDKFIDEIESGTLTTESVVQQAEDEVQRTMERHALLDADLAEMRSRHGTPKPARDRSGAPTGGL